MSGVDVWREAVIDELVCAHIYAAKHDIDPKLAIHEAIAWNVQAALDPAVSRDAAALVDDGYLQAMRHAAIINREMQASIGASEGSSIYAALIACAERMEEIAHERSLTPSRPVSGEG